MSLTKEEDYRLRGIKSGDVQRKPITERIAELKEIYGDKFEYDFTNYKKSSSKIGIICPKHGRDDVHLISLIKGRGCKQCKYETTKKYMLESISIEKRNEKRVENVIKANKNRTTSIDDLLKELNQKHPQNIFKILESNGINSLLEVSCKKHGITKNTFKYLKENKYACKHCANAIVSYDETIWLNNLNIMDRQIKISKYKVDGFDSKSNTIYEYLGVYWHGHPSMKIKHDNFNKRTKKSMDQLFKETEDRFIFLSSLGYNIVYRWENTDIDFVFNGKLEY